MVSLKQRDATKTRRRSGAYDRERLLRLFRFLDYVLTLPEALSRQFDQDLEDIEEVINMPYVTSIKM